MNSPTSHYALMLRSLQDAETLVKTVDPLGCRNSLQHLKLHGYILMVHAIFEEYLENLCRWVALEARDKYCNDGAITKALVALISTSVVDKISNRGRKQISSDLATNLELFTREAVNTFLRVVNENHGIKVKDQAALFFPIGIDLVELDLPLSQNLNSFGVNRGDLAHSFAVQRENTLSDIRTKVESIVDGLLLLDEEACAVCRI